MRTKKLIESNNFVSKSKNKKTDFIYNLKPEGKKNLCILLETIINFLKKNVKEIQNIHQ